MAANPEEVTGGSGPADVGAGGDGSDGLFGGVDLNADDGGHPASATPGPEESSDVPTRPDWLTEDKFWDAEKGLKTDLLFNNYRELVVKQSQGKLEGTVPEKPEAYELTLPEGFPEGVIEQEAFDDDPMVKGFREKAHELKLPSNVASELFDWYLNVAMENQPEPFDKEKELEQLGPTGPAIMEHLSRSAKQWRTIGLLNDQDVEAFRLAVYDAQGAAMMSKIVNHLQGNAQIPTRVPQEGLMSLQQLDAKLHETFDEGPFKGQRKYLVDPVFQEEVDREYEKFYGKEPAGTSVPIEQLLAQSRDT